MFFYCYPYGKRLLLRLLILFGSSATLSAGELVWNEEGILGIASWHDPTHWDPTFDLGPGGPVPYTGIPRAQDTVVIALDGGRAVELNGNTAPVNGLMIRNANQLRTNGHRLTVDNGGAAPLTVSGSVFTHLSISPVADGPAVSTDVLQVSESARAYLYGGAVVQVDTHAALGVDTIVDGSGEIRFGSKATPKAQNVLRNNGTLRSTLWFATGSNPDFATLTLTALGGGTLDLDGHIELPSGLVEEPGRINFSNVFETALDHATIVVDGPLSDPFGGTLEIGSANTADFRRSWSSANGKIRLRGIRAPATLTGAPLVANTTDISALGDGLISNDLTMTSGRLVLGEYATLEFAGTTRIESDVDIDFHPNTVLKVTGQTIVNQSTWEGGNVESMLEIDGGELLLNVDSIGDGNNDYRAKTSVIDGALQVDLADSSPWSNRTEISMEAGTLAGQAMTNRPDGTIRGHGLITAKEINNGGVIEAKGGTLELRSNVVANDDVVTVALDGFSSDGVNHGDGIVRAEAGNILVSSKMSAAFAGRMYIGDLHDFTYDTGRNDDILRIASAADDKEGDGYGGELHMAGGQLVVDQFRQANVFTVNGPTATLVANEIGFLHSSQNDINSTLVLVGSTDIVDAAQFTGSGRMVNAPDSQLTVHGTEIAIDLHNDGRFAALEE